MKTMDWNWIDLTSMKMMMLTIWLAIFTVAIPDSIIGIFALIASVSTIALNINRYYESRKQKDNDGTDKKIH